MQAMKKGMLNRLRATMGQGDNLIPEAAELPGQS
jgi:hypothetical protein